MEQNVKTKRTVTKKVSSNTVAKQNVKKANPTVEQIKARAYQIYIENGYKGNEMENWLKAEKELK